MENPNLINYQFQTNPSSDEIQPLIATDSAQYLQFSSDDNRVLYLAQKDGQINQNIINSTSGSKHSNSTTSN
jgi:hypothetical protein